MLMVKILGGLGNQMFQYAFAKALYQKGYKVKIDISAFEVYKSHQYGLDEYNLDLDIATEDEIKTFGVSGFISRVKNRLRITNSRVIKENSLLFDENLLNVSDNKYLEGYFQTDKYFSDIREILLEQFTLRKDISAYSEHMMDQIGRANKPVSIHIRRGDYLSNTHSKIYSCCDLEYYEKATNLLNEKLGEVTYFIFSDDILWAKDNLKIANGIYIDSKEKRLPHEDLYLMSLCKHNVIANSTFSWWGAWLNQYDEKIVVAPNSWFLNENSGFYANNIVCESWFKV